MRRTILTALCCIFFSTTLFSESRVLQIKGSDTMVNLAQAWAEEFMQRRPEVSIAVTGGGSGTGISAIISGTCDIAQSSRDITDAERAKAERGGVPVKEITAAYDGIAVIVNPANPVSQLTVGQLSDIFTGKITNWKEAGGKDQAVLVLSRERNSGTHVFFLEQVVRRGHPKGPEEFASSVLMMPSSQAIVQEVKTSESAIGYVGLGYAGPEEKLVGIAGTPEGAFVAPSIETVQNKNYPIARPLYFLTRGEPQGVVKDFIDFVLSAEGQEIVRALDFVPLSTSA